MSDYLDDEYFSKAFFNEPNYKGRAIYCIISPKGKKYFGKSKKYCNRMNSHRRDSCYVKDGKFVKQYHLYHAIRKHGWKNMSLVIMEKYDDDCEDIDSILNEREIFFIAHYKTYLNRANGYNLSKGGESSKGYKWTEEQLAYVTALRNTPEYKATMSKAQKKNHARPEVKAKHKAACKEAHNRPEVKEKHRKAMLGNTHALGKKHSAAANKAKSERMTPEYRANLSKKMQGKQNSLGSKLSPEQLLARIARTNTAEFKEQARQKAKGNQNRCEPVVAISPTGVRTEFVSVAIATKELTKLTGDNFSPSKISCVIHGKQTHHRGYKFERPEGYVKTTIRKNRKRRRTE